MILLLFFNAPSSYIACLWLPTPLIRTHRKIPLVYSFQISPGLWEFLICSQVGLSSHAYHSCIPIILISQLLLTVNWPFSFSTALKLRFYFSSMILRTLWNHLRNFELFSLNKLSLVPQILLSICIPCMPCTEMGTCRITIKPFDFLVGSEIWSYILSFVLY